MDKSALVASKLGPSRSASLITPRSITSPTTSMSTKAPAPATTSSSRSYTSPSLSQTPQYPSSLQPQNPTRSVSQPVLPRAQTSISTNNQGGVWDDINSLVFAPSQNSSLPLQYQTISSFANAHASQQPYVHGAMGSNGYPVGVPSMETGINSFEPQNLGMNPFAAPQLPPFVHPTTGSPFASQPPMSSPFPQFQPSLGSLQGMGSAMVQSTTPITNQQPSASFYQPQPQGSMRVLSSQNFLTPSPSQPFVPSPLGQPQFLTPSPSQQFPSHVSQLQMRPQMQPSQSVTHGQFFYQNSTAVQPQMQFGSSTEQGQFPWMTMIQMQQQQQQLQQQQQQQKFQQQQQQQLQQQQQWLQQQLQQQQQQPQMQLQMWPSQPATHGQFFYQNSTMAQPQMQFGSSTEQGQFPWMTMIQMQQQQQQHLSQDIFNQGQPAQMYATCWIAAEHALRHVERYRSQIETTFEHHNIRRSQYAVCAGFDESCIRRGSGYLEQIHIFTLSTILATSPLLTELGKILSPFSSILFTESSRFSLPVYKDDGTIWEFDELVFEMASKYLDHGSTAAMCPTVISLSQTTNNKADESQQDSGGDGESIEKDSRGSKEKGKGQNRNNGNGSENPGDPSRDGNHGSDHPANSGDMDIDGDPDDPDPEGETKETTNSPNIAFEVVSNIYTNGNLSQTFQQINTAGRLTIQVRPHTLTIFKIWI
jgi:stromal membrane-associated protein